MADELEKLTVEQIQSKLVGVWKRYRDDAQKEMAPLLYQLREKLKAQGKAGEGFGVWVEASLDISRRTADRWADSYAISKGLKKKPVPVPRTGKKKSTSGQMSKSGREVTLPLRFRTTDEAKQFSEALGVLGDDEAHDVIVNAVISAAHEMKSDEAAELKLVQ
jgi:hypothetical protein